MSYLTDYYKKQCVLLEERLQYLSSEIYTIQHNLSEADYSSAMDAIINMPVEEFEAKIKGHPQEGMGRTFRRDGRARMGLPPDPPRERSGSTKPSGESAKPSGGPVPGSQSLGKEVSNIISSQFPTKFSQYPKEGFNFVKDTLKSVNPVKLTPGKTLPVGVNLGGVRNIVGLGAGYYGMVGADAAMDAMGIKDQPWADWVRTPVSYAAGGVADTATVAALSGTLPTLGALGAAAGQGGLIGLAAIGGYKAGDYIGDKTGFHNFIANQIEQKSQLNTRPTGLPGGNRAQILKNAREDSSFKVDRQGRVK
jgi:hypothetical protein